MLVLFWHQSCLRKYVYCLSKLLDKDKIVLKNICSNGGKFQTCFLTETMEEKSSCLVWTLEKSYAFQTLCDWNLQMQNNVTQIILFSVPELEPSASSPRVRVSLRSWAASPLRWNRNPDPDSEADPPDHQRPRVRRVPALPNRTDRRKSNAPKQKIFWPFSVSEVCVFPIKD